MRKKCREINRDFARFYINIYIVNYDLNAKNLKESNNFSTN